MISRTVIASLLLVLPLPAEPVSAVPKEIELPVPLQVPTGRPWLGLQLAKADPSTTAHIPTLPKGVGFVISAIDSGGPGEKAKFQPFDLLWKMGDQLLINEAQLATLLRMHKPGDEVTLSVFRSGQSLEVTMKLGDLPIGKDGFNSELADAAILPSDGSPMRVVTFDERTATYSSEEGKAILRREGENYLIVITNAANEVVYQGDISTKEQMDSVPDAWRRRVWSLKRGLDHPPQNQMVPLRAPRPRVVPPPDVAPPGSITGQKP